MGGREEEQVGECSRLQISINIHTTTTTIVTLKYFNNKRTPQ